MIISASYKTDIPAFYGKWFVNRIRAGFCRMVNPYNSNQHYEVSLRPEDVDGFVFWTKNLRPFFPALDEVEDKGYPFILQYTINGYPKELESRVVDAERSTDHFRAAAKRFGSRVMVWRYDTIVYTSLTDADWHRSNFQRLAAGLEGATDEVVVSFMQLYKKTKVNMDQKGRDAGFDWLDPDTEQKFDLLQGLAEIAHKHGMALTMCAQPELEIEGVGKARCVDAKRLGDVGGRPITAKLEGGRPTCGCFKSRDIGDYDTCPHGCVYCYAVTNREVALKRFKQHDPEGEYLFPVPPPVKKSGQGGLFG